MVLEADLAIVSDWSLALGSPASGQQHGKQRAWPLASRPNQGSHCGAF
jgi:hypothetical protein